MLMPSLGSGQIDLLCVCVCVCVCVWSTINIIWLVSMKMQKLKIKVGQSLSASPLIHRYIIIPIYVLYRYIHCEIYFLSPDYSSPL